MAFLLIKVHYEIFHTYQKYTRADRPVPTAHCKKQTLLKEHKSQGTLPRGPRWSLHPLRRQSLIYSSVWLILVRE